MTIAATGTLTTEQAQRATALEKARVVLQTTQAFGSQPADPGDLVAVARFILDGTDLYEEDESDLLTVLDEAQPPADLTADDVVEGHSYVVLPGAKAQGINADYVPTEGAIVTAVEDGVDEDGDAYVRMEDGSGRWVLPEYLIPAL